MRRKVLLLALVLAGLLVAGVVYAQFYAPTVDEVSVTETMTTGGTGGEAVATAVNISANESEETKIKHRARVTGYWEEWRNYNKTRFQYYVDRTEIEWNEAPEKNRPVGRIFVDREPLWNGIWDNKSNVSVTPLDYFENKSRKGNCVITAQVSYELLRVKGKDVRLMSGNNINNGKGHTWTEWIDSQSNELVINFNSVWLKEDWDAMSVWTVNLRQLEPEP